MKFREETIMKRTTEFLRHSVEREVAFLVAHGVLHLLGYDHGEPAAEACMVAFQEEVLGALGISRE